MVDATTFTEQRIAAAQARLIEIDAAISAVLSGAQSYSLDSGQTRQMVTRASLGQLQQMQQHTENQILTLSGRLDGSSAVVVQPGW